MTSERPDADPGRVRPARWRRPVAFGVLAVGALFVSRLLGPVAPREIEMKLALGAFRDANVPVRAVSVALERAGEAVRMIREPRGDRAVSNWVHTVSIPPGEYLARVTLELPGRAVERTEVVRVVGGEPLVLAAPSVP